MTTTITIVGENGLDCATQLRNFFIGLQAVNPTPTDAQAKAGVVAPKKTAKPAIDEDEDAPAPKKKAVKAAVQEDEDDEEDAPAPKKAAAKKPVKKAVDEDEEEEAPKPKKKPEAKASVGELKDNGEDQPATVDGCRIMIRRVARSQGEEYAFAILAEFGVDGATKVPEKKMAKFIERCQEVIDDPDNIELESAE